MLSGFQLYSIFSLALVGILDQNVEMAAGVGEEALSNCHTMFFGGSKLIHSTRTAGAQSNAYRDICLAITLPYPSFPFTNHGGVTLRASLCYRMVQAQRLRQPC